MNPPPFSYSIRRSPRATRTRIVVTNSKIEVVAPPQVAEHRLHQFVSEKQQWVLAALDKMLDKHGQLVEHTPVTYRHGSVIQFQGLSYRLSIQSGLLKRVKIRFDNGFIAEIPNGYAQTEVSAAIKTALTRWLKQQARIQVEQLVKQHAETYQLKPRSIVIKTQKSRWGSCGIRDDININWLLIMAPPEILEYVVVHELCHIRVRNHSADFWRLVAEHLPNYQQQRNWLKQHGAALMREV